MEYVKVLSHNRERERERERKCVEECITEIYLNKFDTRITTPVKLAGFTMT